MLARECVRRSRHVESAAEGLGKGEAGRARRADRRPARADRTRNQGQASGREGRQALPWHDGHEEEAHEEARREEAAAGAGAATCEEAQRPEAQRLEAARAGEKKSPPRSAPRPALIETLAPQLQAAAIHAAAGHAQEFLAPDRRFIASVWDVLRRTKRTDMDLAAFKALLARLQHAGHVRLTRLDLVGAADKRGLRPLLERSEMRRLGAEFHLLAV